MRNVRRRAAISELATDVRRCESAIRSELCEGRMDSVRLRTRGVGSGSRRVSDGPSGIGKAVRCAQPEGAAERCEQPSEVAGVSSHLRSRV